MDRFLQAIKVAVLAVLTVPVAVTGTVVVVAHLPAAAGQPAARARRGPEPHQPRLRRRRQRDRGVPRVRPEHPGEARGHPDHPEAGRDRGRRTATSTSTPASTCAAASALVGRPSRRPRRPGWIHDHPAVREERLHGQRAHHHAQAQRGDPRQPRRRKLSKDEILFRYLNTIYLGEGAYGVGAASETYFRKSVKDLTLSEAALLAAVIPAPSSYQPRGNPDGADASAPVDSANRCWNRATSPRSNTTRRSPKWCGRSRAASRRAPPP